MAKKPETVFQEKVLKRLAMYGKEVWVTKISQISKRGDPDLILCVSGTFIVAELKMPGGKISALQAHTLQQITRAKGIALVVYPENVEEFYYIIEQHIKESEKH